MWGLGWEFPPGQIGCDLGVVSPSSAVCGWGSLARLVWVSHLIISPPLQRPQELVPLGPSCSVPAARDSFISGGLQDPALISISGFSVQVLGDVGCL